MLGIKLFVEARDVSRSTGLGKATFWIGLRQEIYSAIMRNEAISFQVEDCQADEFVDPTSDFDWANRAVLHCADVMTCCFGSGIISMARWSELKKRVELVRGVLFFVSALQLLCVHGCDLLQSCNVTRNIQRHLLTFPNSGKMTPRILSCLFTTSSVTSSTTAFSPRSGTTWAAKVI